jgi:electron transport complex protein RnfC
MHLMPNELSQFVEAEDWIGAESYNILDCIECGSCAFECPAHRPLVQHMKFGKNRVIALRKEREAKKT